LPGALVEQAYLAVQAFTQEIGKLELELCYLLQPGTMHGADSHRI